MKVIGHIYGLQNPLTKEIFYIGATRTSLKMRLKNHYNHLCGYESGERRVNNRFLYLQKLKPLKANIILLEDIYDDKLLDERESFYINEFRLLNPNLTNMTDGGRGGIIHKYFDKERMSEYSERLSKALTGRPKPEGFSEHLSEIRKGKNNPAAREFPKVLVCYLPGMTSKFFRYAFEVDEFIGKNSAYSAVKSYLKRGGNLCYGYKWKYIDEY